MHEFFSKIYEIPREARTLDWSNYEADFVKSLVDDLNNAIHIGELGMPYVYLRMLARTATARTASTRTTPSTSE
jgi:hypothetical protein